MPTLLVVDDEPNLLYSLKKGLQGESLDVITAESASEGIDLVRSERPDAVILDVRLPDMSGLDAFSEIRKLDARLPVVIITAYSTTETAIEAMKRGAFEYLLKPVDIDQLYDVVNRALETSRLSHVPTLYDAHIDESSADHIVGQSTAMQEIYKAIGRVAPQDVNVLILGESGTGKEMVARAIYHHSQRIQSPFLAINCAALPDTLLESELFGHERGAFTGADRRRIGKFEQVDGGTILLDEIGDMSSATQAKVLRLLQDGSFERVGSNETIQVDVRVIAATNQDFAAMVQQGRFRQDLYYRLKVFTIELPTLRDRAEDIPLLADHFIRTFNRDLKKNVSAVSPDAMELIRQYTWPGNVRELQSAVKFAMVHAVGDRITSDCLPAVCRQLRPDTPARPLYSASSLGEAGDITRMTERLINEGDTDIYRKVHSDVDRTLLRILLDHVGGNQTQAAQLLGISRSTLHARINDLGLVLERRVLPDPIGGEHQSQASQDE